MTPKCLLKRSSSSLLFACALGVITARSQGTDPSGKMDAILTFVTVKENGDVKWRQIVIVVIVVVVVVIKSQITSYLH